MFRLEEFMEKIVLKSSLLDNGNVVAFFTTRDLPLKYGEREDLAEEIENNKKLVCKGLNIPEENLVIPQQTHSDNVEIIDIQKTVYENCDGLITNKKNVALGLNFADCVPLMFFDSEKKVIASAHAGWRGTAAKIGVKTLQKMIDKFGCNPENIIALIGPCIGKCCFEVKDDVKAQIISTIDEKYHVEVCDKNNLDLKLINKFQLLSNGIKKIDVCEYCTSCKNELFFSYRKEKGHTARHSSVIMLKDQERK